MAANDSDIASDLGAGAEARVAADRHEVALYAAVNVDGPADSYDVAFHKAMHGGRAADAHHVFGCLVFVDDDAAAKAYLITELRLGQGKRREEKDHHEHGCAASHDCLRPAKP
jgi:hypothetical protein